MSRRKKGRITHFYRKEVRRILCGETDPGAHWTTAGGWHVSCPRCRELLRKLRERDTSRARRPLGQ